MVGMRLKVRQTFSIWHTRSILQSLFSRDVAEIPNRSAVNVQVSSAVSRFQNRIPRLEPVDSHDSDHIPTLPCKICPSFS